MRSIDLKKAKEILSTLSLDIENVDERLRDWWLCYLNSHTKHYLALIELLNRCNNSNLENILEVGSVPGHFSILLRKIGFQVTGIDIKPERADGIWSKYKIPCYKVDIESEKIPIEDESYDLIIFAEILEHLRKEPLFALKETYRVLKPGGHIIVSIPNITPIDRINFLFGKDYQGNIIKEFEKLSWLGHMGHFRIYSFNEACEIIRYIGFESIEHFRRGDISKRMLSTLFALTPWRNQLRPHLYMLAKK